MNAPQAAGVSVSAAVSAAGLSKRYGELAAVDGLDLDIAPGEFFGLLGPNGSGKTTTMHMLATLIRPSAGTARVAGFDIAGAPVQVRASIGLVFQESALDRTLTVAQNLRFAGLLHDLPPRAIEERGRELLELFDLAERRDQPVGTLSGGMRRALDIVRGVLHQPRCLLLDEPTIGLDPAAAREVRALVRTLADDGVTVFLSSHNMSEVDEVCDSVVIVDRGRTVWDGTLEQLRAEAPAPTYRLETSDDARALRIGRFEAGVELEPIGERGLRLRAEVAARDEYVLTLGRFGVAVRTLEPEITPLEALFDQLTVAA